MISSNLQTTSPQPKNRNDAPSGHQTPRDRESKHFRALLDEIAADIQPFQPAALLFDNGNSQLDDKNAASSFSASRPSFAQNPAISPSQMIEEIQSVLVKLCNGPLAGLVIQANWQGRRLDIKLSAPAGPTSKRLALEEHNLGMTLSTALGVEVSVKVEEASREAALASVAYESSAPVIAAAWRK